MRPRCRRPRSRSTAWSSILGGTSLQLGGGTLSLIDSTVDLKQDQVARSRASSIHEESRRDGDPTMSDPAIEVKDFRKVFRIGFRRKRSVAADGITFTVEPNEVFGFLGPNGA